MLKFVVVPGERIGERAYYDGAIAAPCVADATCFLRFFTNSTDAPVSMPLADAILAEPTASFQRSANKNNEVFERSRRMMMSGNCFCANPPCATRQTSRRPECCPATHL